MRNVGPVGASYFLVDDEFMPRRTLRATAVSIDLMGGFELGLQSNVRADDTRSDQHETVPPVLIPHLDRYKRRQL